MRLGRGGAAHALEREDAAEQRPARGVARRFPDHLGQRAVALLGQLGDRDVALHRNPCRRRRIPPRGDAVKQPREKARQIVCARLGERVGRHRRVGLPFHSQGDFSRLRPIAYCQKTRHQHGVPLRGRNTGVARDEHLPRAQLNAGQPRRREPVADGRNIFQERACLGDWHFAPRLECGQQIIASGCREEDRREIAVCTDRTRREHGRQIQRRELSRVLPHAIEELGICAHFRIEHMHEYQPRVRRDRPREVGAAAGAVAEDPRHFKIVFEPSGECLDRRGWHRGRFSGAGHAARWRGDEIGENRHPHRKCGVVQHIEHLRRARRAPQPILLDEALDQPAQFGRQFRGQLSGIAGEAEPAADDLRRVSRIRRASHREVPERHAEGK